MENSKFLGVFTPVPKEIFGDSHVVIFCFVMVSGINITDFEYFKYILILSFKQ